MVYPALLPLMPHTSAASSRLNWCPLADLNGLANAVGSQYPSHYLGTWCIQHYYRWCRTPRLPVVDWTDASRRFKRTRLFRLKTKSCFFACTIAFQLASNFILRACILHYIELVVITWPSMRIGYLVTWYITYSSVIVTYVHIPTHKNFDPNSVHICYWVQLYLKIVCSHDYMFRYQSLLE